MIEIIILIVILFIIFSKNNKEHYSNKIELTMDSISGRGVKAIDDIKENDIIEICPYLEDNKDNFQGILKDYIFKSKTDNKSLLAFGLCSIYNHNDENNVGHAVNYDNQTFIIKANRDIKKGEELFLNYGSGYWSSRNIKKL